MSIYAFLLTLASSLSQASWNLGTKKWSHNETLLVVGQAMSIPVFALLLFYFPLDWGLLWTHGWLIAFTTILHVFYYILLLYAYRISDVSNIFPMIRGLGVGIAGVESILLFHEFPGGWAITGFVLVILGLFIAAKPRKGQLSDRRVVMVVLGIGIIIGVFYPIDAYLSRTLGAIPFLIVMNAGMVLGLFFYYLKACPEQLLDSVRTKKRLSFSLGFVAMGSYVLLMFAVQKAPVSSVLALRESSIIFVSLGAVLFLKEHLRLNRILGIALILIAVLCMKL
jgi:uncharacterized membrane protein